ncbi:MAG: phosphotransferase [Candidatus Magnetomorum sp.]|nr:phosphotransferase [Candidatus Magnetomorum sp.]
MQAMILAAGMGTRLRPHTHICPKPLFAIDGQPIIHRTIMQLIADGYKDILINTHHLADTIKDFIDCQNYPVPVRLCHETEILGTGGGIKNMLQHVQSFPVLVVNSDIVTDLNFKHLFDIHQKHDAPVTLIMHDAPQFNTVKIERNSVYNFKCSEFGDHIRAFTGIHIIDSLVGDYIPENKSYSIIAAYEQMIQDGHRIHAHGVANHYWADIGTPEGYGNASAKMLSQTAFQRVWPNTSFNQLQSTKLKGDGSDRLWFRYHDQEHSLIMVNHGISCLSVQGISLEKNQDRSNQHCTEVESFVKIGKHLHHADIPVPRIIHHDFFSGIVFVEDLGNVHFQDYILQLNGDLSGIQSAYESVINILIHMSTAGAKGFESTFTCQTTHYDPKMILSLECHYFMRAFVQDYMGVNISFAELEKEFFHLANEAMKHIQWGLMHRDFQSRNIMIANNKFYIIDFQGARWGPVQYDLASLLIDPYVGLPKDLQDHLLTYCLEKYKQAALDVDDQEFKKTYHYCRLFRNLQMLGAFAFLSQKKGKTSFKQYIPPAISLLRQHLEDSLFIDCPGLKKLLLRIEHFP